MVRLPFISNFTDFDALADEPDVNVRYVTDAERSSAAPTAIVLPGTKSTIADLAWLRASGLAAARAGAAAAGTPVIGICGGYQMLGRRILDPEHVESDGRAVDGLGLLDVETTFAGDKRTVRVDGEVLASAGPARACSAAGRYAPARLRDPHGSHDARGAAPRHCCGCAAPTAPSTPTARSPCRRPDPGPSARGRSAAVTSTASSTIRRCAAPS